MTKLYTRSDSQARRTLARMVRRARSANMPAQMTTMYLLGARHALPVQETTYRQMYRIEDLLYGRYREVR